MYLSLLWQQKGTYLLKYLILLLSLTLFLINSIKYPCRKYALVSVLEVCEDAYSCRSEEQQAICNTDWISPSPFSLQSSPFQRNHPRYNSFDVGERWLLILGCFGGLSQHVKNFHGCKALTQQLLYFHSSCWLKSWRLPCSPAIPSRSFDLLEILAAGLTEKDKITGLASWAMAGRWPENQFLGTCTFPQFCGVLLGCSWTIRPLCVEQLLNKMGFKKTQYGLSAQGYCTIRVNS